MPYLSIIPAAAVADGRLSDTHIRVLCAIGTHTNKLGGNVWASVGTLAKESNLSERTVQRSLAALIEAGYLRKTERTGRTNLYDVLLDGVSTESPTPVTTVTPPPSVQSPKRVKERYTLTGDDTQCLSYCWATFPKRDMPTPYPLWVVAFRDLRTAGVSCDDIAKAAHSYAAHVTKNGTEQKYRKTIHRFYTDDSWKAFCEQTVGGRTRDEWARSGQDVEEFDKMAAV
jgi:DNA-binding transcriptional ArsR family regulator